MAVWKTELWSCFEKSSFVVHRKVTTCKVRVSKWWQKKFVLVMLFWSLFIFCFFLFISFWRPTTASLKIQSDILKHCQRIHLNLKIFLLNWLWKYINITKIRRPTIKIKQFGGQSVLFYFSYVPCHLFIFKN